MRTFATYRFLLTCRNRLRQNPILQKISTLWDKISTEGVPETLAPEKKENFILLNRMFYLFFVYGSIYPLVAMICTVHIYLVEGADTDMYLFIKYIYPAACCTSLAIFAFFFIWRNKRKSQSQLLKAWANRFIVLVVTIIVCNAPLFPLEIPFSFFLMPCVISWIIFNNRSSSFTRNFALWYTVFFGFLATFQQFFLEPTYKIPQYIIDWVGIIVALLIFFYSIALIYYLKYQSEQTKLQLLLERTTTDGILKNILPQQVCLEIKQNGYSEPVYFEAATILQTDFVGFTKIAEQMTPIELLRELDLCFAYFDQVIKKNKIEKIKTIGDAYLAAGGVPVSNRTHPIDCALAALEIKAIMEQVKAVKKAVNLDFWELRVGMHTGALVAGVSFNDKLSYDIWGKGVNITSQLE
ncbi:MAG: adenylate/guanylate cyclase domain-containing protein, partial [Spirochaetota bacterium]